MNFHVGNSESSGFGLFSRAVNHAMLRYAGCAGIVVVFAGVFGGSGARAAPFANGSFELPGLSAGSSTELLPGNTALPGWTVSGSGGPISYGYSGTSAKHGSHDLTFNSGNRSPGMRISQTFDMVPGTNYLVTFHIRRSGAGPGATCTRRRWSSSSGSRSSASITPACPSTTLPRTATFRRR